MFVERPKEQKREKSGKKENIKLRFIVHSNLIIIVFKEEKENKNWSHRLTYLALIWFSPYIVFLLKRLDTFSFLNQECQSLTSVKEDGCDQRFVLLEISMEVDVALSYSFRPGYRCCDCGDSWADFCVTGSIIWQACSQVFTAGNLLRSGFAVHADADTDVPCAIHHWIYRCWAAFHKRRFFQRVFCQILQLNVIA